MKKSNYISIGIAALVLSGSSLFAQVAFTNANTKLTGAEVHSGCPVAIVDWNGDGKDDIIRLDQTTDCSVEIQRTNNTYDHVSLGTFTGSGNAWAMAVADVDHNGYADVISGGYGNAVQILKSNSNGTGATLYSIPNSNFFLQNITCCDANNDGWIDIFCCDDNAAAHLFMNDGAGNFTESTTQIVLAINPTIFYSGDPADSGNYGSAWIDFDNDGDLDLYVAHCRQSTSSTTDLRRKDRLFVNDGNNNFTEQAGNYGIETTVFNQTWTASFGDIDNDGDLDLMVTNHDVKSQILLNDGTGHYTDITIGTGFDISDITPIESVMEDFDNDGFNDIFVTGSAARFFHNNGNNTFTKMPNMFDGNDMESFAIGDLNHDGFIDIYSSYASIYTTPGDSADVIWMNNGNSNNFITVELKGTVSNHSAIGARATIYGTWGTQIREVRAGESYGTNNSAMCHFGLGAATTIDSLTIHWPSGIDQTITDPTINQFITVIEGNCVSPEAIITTTGQPIICPGQTTTLSAPVGYDYLWSDGSTNQTLVVAASGEYNVMISTVGNQCHAISKTVIVQYNPDQTPVINVIGETEICNGGAVTLAAPAGMQSYTWSNGDTNQNAVITQSGTYTLTVMGACQAWTANTPVTVTAHTVANPLASNVNITAPGTANLWANGNNINWYDAATGGNLLGSGNAFITPFLNANTTFYASNSEAYGNGIFPLGMANHSGTNYYSSGGTNAIMYFDVTKTCIIKSAKVITDTYGIRRFELRNNAGTVLAFADVDLITDTTVVMLNFTVNPGTQYQLATNEAANLAIAGWNQVSPKLQRNISGATYPYTLADALSITGNNQGPQYYYYFYDWQVEKPGLLCESDRSPANVTIGPVGINENQFISSITVYPNPSSALFNVSFETIKQGDVQLEISDLAGRKVLTYNEQKVNGTFTKALNLDGNAKGVYVLKITCGSQVHHQKITLK